jgi:cation diffusion facilitator CzcD-associated flavoprotein CzcO
MSTTTICEECSSTTSQTTLLVRHNISWIPHPKSFLKLNVDAHLHDDGCWGYEMVLRRADGHCVGAANKVLKGFNDVTLAEVVGIREALN